ncbi:META domain-containing protein [Puniceibacterium sp. IMCC21224]|uniref:META domain-containing protein n=1 Tax=Puniceibacterium sp. IMCC21224 TaxID=1618204 RepID=UPI001E2F87D3|nr:META domain-containing protein [Puniceibacterium sp. IMCC21224]
MLSACAADETVFSYGAGERTWELQAVNGAPFPAKVALMFPRPGRIEGQGPCNRFSAAQRVPYPWFEAGPLIVTRLSCPDQQAEAQFLDLLSRMELARVDGDRLILSVWDGDELVFILRPDD